MADAPHARLVVVSGPSGVGKTTVMKQVFQRRPIALVQSVSATTRPPRPGERDGADYHFLSNEDFQRRLAAGEFLEAVEVFGCGHWYGTLRKEVTAGLAEGKWVVLEIEVDGARTVMDQFPDAVTIFVRPSSLEELERRLRGRGTEAEEALQRRLRRAQYEFDQAHRYRYVVVNDTIEQAVEEICEILIAESALAPKVEV
jgi:guanylate kinase